MKNIIQFETPENIKVTYEVAGIGSRFVAWFEDQLILFVITILVYLALLFLGPGAHFIGELISDSKMDEIETFSYMIGLVILFVGFFNFLYFGLSELLMRGQTIGKRHARIRVVKLNGYALDPASILVRNAFRVMDHIPLLWVVPIFSPRHQRLGDFVAGTLCIADDPRKLGNIREVLLARPASEREFRFDIGALSRVRESDIAAVEKILEEFPTVRDDYQEQLMEILCKPLAERMKVAAPDPDKRKQFLEDLLAAEYRRQQRQLG